MNSILKNRIITLLLIVIIGMFLGLTIRGEKGNPEPLTVKQQYDGAAKAFELSPERGRFAHIMALSETGRYPLTKELGEFVYPDVGYYNGQFFSFFAPGISYLAVPLFLVGWSVGLAQVSAFSLIALFAILGCLVIYKIAIDIFKLPIWAAIFAALLFVFGTTAWSYAITLYQHHVTVFAMLLGFYATWRYRRSSTGGWAWASTVWFCYGLAIFVDYPNLLLLLPVMVYFGLSSIKVTRDKTKVSISLRWAFVFSAVIFLLISGLHFYHNATYFGSWKNLSSSLVDYKTLQERNLLDQSAESQSQVSAIEKRKSNVVRFFSDEKIPRSPGTLLFSKDRGLFVFVPVLLFGILGLIHLFKRVKPESYVAIALVGVNLFLYSSWGDPWGGWAYGPRYLIPSMSILALGVAAWLASNHQRIYKRIIVLPFLAYSLAVALLGAITTNAVPPRVEADALNLKYNFLFNIDFLKQGRSGSFFFNSYISNHLSLTEYFWIILGILMLIFLIVLFLLPRIMSRRDQVMEDKNV